MENKNNTGIQTSGYMCMTCGTWIPLGTTHDCISSLGSTKIFPTAEFLILGQLTRIADALEKLAAAAERCSNES